MYTVDKVRIDIMDENIQKGHKYKEIDDILILRNWTQWIKWTKSDTIVEIGQN